MPNATQPSASSSTIRILFVTATSDRGGAETLLVELLRRLPHVDFQCRVLSMTGGGWLTARCREEGIDAETWSQLGLLPRWNALRRVLREWQPHTVHAFGLRAEVMARPAVRMYGQGASYISAAHSPDPSRSWVQVALDRLTSRWCDHFLAVSQTVAEGRRQRERWPVNKITVIPNGVEPPPAESLEPERRREIRLRLAQQLGLDPQGGPWLLMVANLRPMKGYGEALEALAVLAPQIPGLRLLAVGQDVARGAWAARARQLGIAERVTWAGYRENPAEFMAASDLFWMPSRWEGCPTALLEAMSWALPIVATRIGGVEEIARHEVEVLLVPVGDSQALASETHRILSDDLLARRLADSARKRVLESYSLQRMTQAHIQLYRQ